MPHSAGSQNQSPKLDMSGNLSIISVPVDYNQVPDEELVPAFCKTTRAPLPLTDCNAKNFYKRMVKDAQKGVQDTHQKGQWQYQPLDSNRNEIRVFQLLPGKPADQIHGRMIRVVLSEETTYEALSYSWVDSEIVCPIFIEGTAFWGATINLVAALRRLRRRTASRTLWIDAICINQADNAEKSRQVALMRHIYQNAVRVVIWLGHSYMFMGQGLSKVSGMLGGTLYAANAKLGDDLDKGALVAPWKDVDDRLQLVELQAVIHIFPRRN